MRTDGYKLRLCYVTTGRCSKTCIDEANYLVKSVNSKATIEFYQHEHIRLLVEDYRDGVAPPVQALELDMNGAADATVCGPFERFDLGTQIETWLFAVNGMVLSSAYEKAGNRIFSRNVRGFLGNNRVNRSIQKTIKQEPEYFLYYNNGVTIICDDASKETREGRSVLRVTNPQIINGQQTTRILHSMGNLSAKTCVLVRVIRIPRKDNQYRFEKLVKKIVTATNRQNSIRASDLMANDRVHIELDRNLRKLGYWYLRKRQPKAEAKAFIDTNAYQIIPKEELAQASAACDLDPAIVRQGKEGLFEEEIHKRIFQSANAYHYLTRYWLMKAVISRAGKIKGMTYAKWLAINFIWFQIGNDFTSKANAYYFVEEASTKGPGYNNLVSLIDVVYRAAKKFYNLNRDIDFEENDVSKTEKLEALSRV